MWRTVIVNQGEKIKTEQNWLVVVSDSGESKIPIEDIYTVVIDNQNAMISLSAINALTSSGAHICFCNDKHIPAVEADRGSQDQESGEVPAVLQRQSRQGCLRGAACR